MPAPPSGFCEPSLGLDPCVCTRAPLKEAGSNFLRPVGRAHGQQPLEAPAWQAFTLFAGWGVHSCVRRWVHVYLPPEEDQSRS